MKNFSFTPHLIRNAMHSWRKFIFNIFLLQRKRLRGQGAGFKILSGGGLIRVIIISLFATLACAGIIKAATTIGTNITTGGALSVDGVSTLTGNTNVAGSLTSSGANTFYGATSIGGAITATSTLTVSGNSVFSTASSTGIVKFAQINSDTGAISFGDENLSTTGTLNITGLTTLGNASTTLLSVSGATWLSTTIISAGNLGIGTSSPYAKLSVVGEVVGSYFTATSTTATSTFANGIYITSGCFRGSDGNCITSGGGGSGTVNTGSAGYLSYYPGAGTTVDDASNLYWDNTNSRLGIGTTSPYAKLSVVGEIVGSYFTATSTTATSSFAGAVAVGGTNERVQGTDSYIDFNEPTPTGSLRLGAYGLTNNESLDWDYETVANQVSISSASGVNKLVVSGMGLDIQAGSGTGNTKVGGILYSSPVAQTVGAVGDVWTTSHTYTIPANTLNANGRAVRITTSVRLIDNYTTKSYQILFGNVVVATATSDTLISILYFNTAIVTRNGSNTQLYMSSTNSDTAGHVTVKRGSGTVTDSSDIVIALQCKENAAETSGTICTSDFFIVELINP